MARRTIYSHDRLHVDAVRTADGSLRIEGQDLRGAEEYEYFFTIAAPDVPRLAEALGGGDPMDELVRQGVAIVTAGELHWLRDHGVPHSLTTV